MLSYTSNTDESISRGAEVTWRRQPCDSWAGVCLTVAARYPRRQDADEERHEPPALPRTMPTPVAYQAR